MGIKKKVILVIQLFIINSIFSQSMIDSLLRRGQVSAVVDTYLDANDICKQEHGPIVVVLTLNPSFFFTKGFDYSIPRKVIKDTSEIVDAYFYVSRIRDFAFFEKYPPDHISELNNAFIFLYFKFQGYQPPIRKGNSDIRFFLQTYVTPSFEESPTWVVKEEPDWVRIFKLKKFNEAMFKKLISKNIE